MNNLRQKLKTMTTKNDTRAKYIISYLKTDESVKIVTFNIKNDVFASYDFFEKLETAYTDIKVIYR